MAGAFVQSWGNSSTTAGTSVTVTVSGATANNLLVSVVSVRNDSGTTPTATGWTAIQDYNSASAGAGGAMFYRIASGDSNDNFAPSWTTTQLYAASVCEYSGLDSASPLETSGEYTTYADTDQTNGDPISSGSATPSTANGTAIAFSCSPDERDANETELSIDNSYTIDDFETPTNGLYATVAIASKNYTTTAAQSPNWASSSNRDWKLYNAIATFKEANGGGTTPYIQYYHYLYAGGGQGL